MKSISLLAATAFLALSIGLGIGLTYDDVPEYKNWGAHETNRDCVCCLDRMEEIDKTDALNEPVSAISSLMFLPACFDSDAAVIFGGVLTAASFVLHSDGSEEARVLDFYSAAAGPAVIAFISVPPLSGIALAVALIIGYETRGSEWIIGGVGAGIALLAVIYTKIDAHHAIAVICCLVSAGLLRGGGKLDAVCANDVKLAAAYDARHFAWHLSVSLLLWLGIGVLNKKPRAYPRLASGITLIPLISLLTDLGDIYLASWLTTTYLAVLLLGGVALLSEKEEVLQTSLSRQALL